jgi:sugar/nucleoside kinase (ribokinase family)
MQVLTIGGATQDIFIHYNGTDIMSITKKNFHSNYMLFGSGEKIEVEKLTYETGGGATNSAVSFQRLGMTASCFCNIGNDAAGQTIIDKLTEENINTTLILQSAKHKTGTSFIVNSIEGDYTIFAYRGANSYLELDKLPFDAIKECDQLYITSLSNDSAQILPSIVSFAKKHNVPVAINPGSSQLEKGTQKLKESLQFIDTLILNKHEAQIFMFALMQNDKYYKEVFECSGPDQICRSSEMEDDQAYLLNTPIIYENTYFSLRNFFKATLDMGPKIVVVTNGANGVYVANKDEIIFHPSMKIKITNTVGAGDAFGSCFVASLMHKNDTRTALKYGIVNSASVLEHVGAKTGLLTYDQLLLRTNTKNSDLLKSFKF